MLWRGIVFCISLSVLLTPGCQSPTPEKPPETAQKPDVKQPPKPDEKKPATNTPQNPPKPDEKIKVAELTPQNPPKPDEKKQPGAEEKSKADETLQQIGERRDLAEQQKAAFVQNLIKNAKSKNANHEYNLAKSFLDEALRLDPGNQEAQKMRGFVGSILGEPVAQGSYLHNIYIDEVKVKIEQAKLEARNHFKNADEAFLAKDYDRAIREFEASLEIMKWAPYPLNLESLQKQAELKIKDARENRDRLTKAQQEEKMAQAKKKAAQLEAEEQARRMTQLKILLDKATEYYINQKYDQAELMVKQVLELDNSNKVAKKLHEDIRDASHSYISQKTLERRVEGWKKFLENIRESAVPLSKDITYPNKEYWHNVVSKRQGESELSQTKKDKGDETQAIRRIKTQLETGTAQWSFADTPFQDVVTFIRTTNDLNIVVDPKVLQTFQLDGVKVTLELRDLRLKDAMNVLLEFYNLTYLFKDDVLFITKKDSDLAKEKSMLVLHDIRDLTGQIKDFPGPKIQLAAAKQGGASGGALFTEDKGQGGAVLTGEKLTELIKISIAPDTWGKEDFSIAETSGHLVVVQTEDVQHEIRGFLNDMRRFSGMMVAIEARFLEVTDDFLEQLGVDWRGKGNEQITSNTNQVSLSGVTTGPDDSASSSSPPDNKGLNNAPSTGLFFREKTVPGGNGRDPMGRSDVRIRTENVDDQTLGNRMKATGGLALQFSTLDDVNLNAVLWMVKKSGRQEVLMSPRLTTYNTQRANITVVDQEAYVKDFDVQVAQSAYIADPVIGTIQTGVVLDVRPIIANDRKYITLELRPTVAGLDETRSFTTTLGASGRSVTFDIPTIRLQSVESTVRIPDQGTLLIAGFKSFREIDRKQDIPILGNIPIISFFFSQRTKVDEKQSLIILVTAKIIDLEEQEEKAVGTPK